MGYDVLFEGHFTLDRPLAPDHRAALVALAEVEHAGEDGMPTEEADSGRPCPYCQWVPTPDGRGIEWDMNEKFAGWLEWLVFLIDRRLKPWGYAVNGEVRWRGADLADAGVIYVREGRVEAVPDVNPGPSWGPA